MFSDFTSWFYRLYIQNCEAGINIGKELKKSHDIAESHNPNAEDTSSYVGPR